MRLVFIAGSIALLTACGSNFVLQQDTDVVISELYYWEDQDGDGWGNPGEPQSLPEGGDSATKFTARNGRDCDDGVAGITGRTGSLCPQDLVTDGTPAAGVTLGSVEFVAVLPDGEPVWAEYGRDACATEGWGGTLATFDSAAEVDELEGLIPGDTWAGWIGVVPDEAACPGPFGDGETYDSYAACCAEEECWSWEGGAGSASFPPSALAFCSDVDRNPEDDKFFGLDTPRLALVRRPTGTPSWCLGTPDEADFDLYIDRYAQFACVRDAPNPADWAVWNLDTE